MHDMPVAFAWFVIVLSFPLGLAGILTQVLLWPTFPEDIGLSETGFAGILLLWTVTFLLGYWQWFILCPSIARRTSLWQESNGA